MQINLVFDSSVANAPAGFKTAAEAAASFYDALITNPITVTIDVGWNEVAGSRIGTQALAESETNGYFYNYAQVSQALTSVATSSADHASVATLPASDPTAGGQFFVATAEAQALGLAGPTQGGPDGYVGVSSAFPWTFDPGNRAVTGKFDAVGALEHEISEVLGRIGDLGMDSFQGAKEYDPIDLFRWTSPGVRDLTPGPGWFSVDGQNLLQLFNDPTQGGDVADWDPSIYGDSYGDGAPGIAGLVTPVDVTEMDVLGYDIAGQNAAFTGLERQYAVSLAGGTIDVSGGPEGASHALSGATTIGFADGALSFDPSGVAAQVYDLMDAAYGKPARPAFEQAHIEAIQSGATTIAALANAIARSPKFRASIAGMSESQIVAHVFETALRRAPSASETTQWSSFLAGGGGVGAMLVQIAQSSEHLALTAGAVAAGLWVVDPAYAATEYAFQAAFGRAPSAAEFAQWAPQVAGGLGETGLTADLVATAPFQQSMTGLSDTAIVSQVFQTALGRAPSAAEAATWTAFLVAGNPVVGVLTAIEQTTEFLKRAGPDVATGVLASGLGSNGATADATQNVAAFAQAMATRADDGAITTFAPRLSEGWRFGVLARPGAAIA